MYCIRWICSFLLDCNKNDTQCVCWKRTDWNFRMTQKKREMMQSKALTNWILTINCQRKKLVWGSTKRFIEKINIDISIYLFICLFFKRHKYESSWTIYICTILCIQTDRETETKRIAWLWLLLCVWANKNILKTFKKNKNYWIAA